MEDFLTRPEPSYIRDNGFPLTETDLDHLVFLECKRMFNNMVNPTKPFTREVLNKTAEHSERDINKILESFLDTLPEIEDSKIPFLVEYKIYSILKRMRDIRFVWNDKFNFGSDYYYKNNGFILFPNIMFELREENKDYPVETERQITGSNLLISP